MNSCEHAASAAATKHRLDQNTHKKQVAYLLLYRLESTAARAALMRTATKIVVVNNDFERKSFRSSTMEGVRKFVDMRLEIISLFGFSFNFAAIRSRTFFSCRSKCPRRFAFLIQHDAHYLIVFFQARSNHVCSSTRCTGSCCCAGYGDLARPLPVSSRRVGRGRPRSLFVCSHLRAQDDSGEVVFGVNRDVHLYRKQGALCADTSMEVAGHMSVCVRA